MVKTDLDYYDKIKLLNSKKEILRMLKFLRRKKYYDKNDNIYKIANDDDALLVLFNISISKGFKPDEKFRIKTIKKPC